MSTDTNKKLSEEERLEIMASPEFEFQKPSQKSVSFSSQEKLVEPKEVRSESESKSKYELTGSTIFRSLASFLQTHQPISNSEEKTKLVLPNQEQGRTYHLQVIDNLLLNLEIISRIKEYDKLADQDKILEIDNRVGQFFRRWFSGDSRNRTLSRIEEIVDLTIEITQKLLEDEYDDSLRTFDEKETLIRSFETNKSEYFQKFSKNMGDAIRGLNNLKKTYVNDEAIKSRIDMVIDKLSRRLGKIAEKLQIRTRPS